MHVRCLRTDYDIGAVYALPEAENELIDVKFELSMDVAIDIRNFWLRHLLNPDEGTFHTAYMSLPKYHRPAPPSPMGRTLYDEKRKLPLSWLGYECQSSFRITFCPSLWDILIDANTPQHAFARTHPQCQSLKFDKPALISTATYLKLNT